MAKKTIKRDNKFISKAKGIKKETTVKRTTVAKKAPAKKVPAKKEVKLTQIKAKIVGKNFVAMIDGTKLVKTNISDKDLNSITTKISIYNKQSTQARKEAILKFFESEKEKLKETKAMKAKGIKKAIKKVIKEKVSKNEEAPEEIIEKEVSKNEEAKEEISKVVQSVEENKKIEQPKAQYSNTGRRGEF